jgi:hypothetical protein
MEDFGLHGGDFLRVGREGSQRVGEVAPEKDGPVASDDSDGDRVAMQGLGEGAVLAHQLGIHAAAPGTIGLAGRAALPRRLANGRKSMTLNTLRILADTLGVLVRDLVGKP